MTKHVRGGAIVVFVLMVGLVGCGDESTTGPKNTVPTAAFTVTPTSGTTETEFQFDASGSTDGEDAVSSLQVRWDWEDDGTWDEDWTTTKTATHQYGAGGNKTVRLEVKDTGGATVDTTETVTVTGGPMLGQMVLVPAGSFEMGDGESCCGTAKHQVTLTRSFHLGKYEVTNKEYRDALQWAYDRNPKLVTVSGSEVRDAVDGSNALLLHLGYRISFSGGTFSVAAECENHPVALVTWYGAAAYCDWLSLQAGLTRAYNHSTWQCNNGDPSRASGYRLPTDAEWEYATQYGGERIYPWGNEAPDCSRANYWGQIGGCVGTTRPVGSYPGWTVVNADMIYDMAGNVWEWCNDWHTCDLRTSPAQNPPGPVSGGSRVLRGGSWDHGNEYLRCAARCDSDLGLPSNTSILHGFRCARRQ